MYAAASWICFSVSALGGAVGAGLSLPGSVSLLAGGGARGSLRGPPMPICTGVAAPRLVPGAMAAMWLAYRMYVPALAARAPLGNTKVATGIGEARIPLMMSRIAVSRPPGVSIVSTTRLEPFSTERFKPCEK